MKYIIKAQRRGQTIAATIVKTRKQGDLARAISELLAFVRRLTGKSIYSVSVKVKQI